MEVERAIQQRKAAQAETRSKALPSMGWLTCPVVLDVQLRLQAKQQPDYKATVAAAALAPKFEQHISELQAEVATANTRCTSPCQSVAQPLLCCKQMSGVRTHVTCLLSWPLS